MDDVLVFVLTAACFAVLNRRDPSFRVKPSKISVAAALFYLALTAAALALKYLAPVHLIWFFPAAWLAVLASFNLIYGAGSPGLYFYEILFIADTASFLMMPQGPLTPYIFFISSFIFLLMTPPAYRGLLDGKNLYPSFFFMLFSVFFVKIFILGRLTPWISAPVAVLCGLFICVRECGSIEYYTGEKNLLPAAALLYTSFLAQCFLAAVLKTPFFRR